MRFKIASNIHHNFFFVYFLLSMFVFMSCDKEVDKEEVIVPAASLEVSYSLKLGYRYNIAQDDTIKATLGDTLTLYVVGYNVSDFSGIWGDGEIEITDHENKEYTCILTKSGLFSMEAYAVEEDGSLLSVAFTVNILSLDYHIVIASEPVITIDGDDETLKDIIQAELENHTLFPSKYTEYTLKCNTINEGDFICATTSSEEVSGTFTSSNVLTLNDVVLSCDNLEYGFTFEKIESDDGGYLYWMEQDFTSMFQNKYPDVNKVTVRTKSLKSVRRKT